MQERRKTPSARWELVDEDVVFSVDHRTKLRRVRGVVVVVRQVKEQRKDVDVAANLRIDSA